MNLISLITTRYIFKNIYKTLVKSSVEKKRGVSNILIYGAGEMGTIVYSILKKSNENNTKVIAFIDDDIKKQGNKIDRIEVVSMATITDDYVRSHKIKEVVLAINDIQQSRLIEISDQLLNLSIKIKVVPTVSKWVGGDLILQEIQDVKIEDLLNRTPIKLNNPEIDKYIHGKVILVTGAAGSIGSEIVRQLLTYNCKKVILVDQAESFLYDLQQDLKNQSRHNIECYVTDVRDVLMMESLFKKHQPHVVFHAAAYKHVPFMESNPYESIKVNVAGTKNIVDLALKYKIDKFVMISTDKAVNPTNVMGATKRIAELYVASKSKQGTTTKFITTRFGNVLGSNGSVIPLFKKQIARGGPITLTHKEITRYFMTIQEACQLVIEAGSMGKGGDVFIFDMGESVKIKDLAKRMIKLSGLNYPNDIDIKIVGLRPGEKLYEELLNDGENTIPTYHKKIMISKTEDFDYKNKLCLIEDLINNNKPDNFMSLVKKMKIIVPEFLSQNSIYVCLDKVSKNQ